uniref:Kaptin n=1 Tax=Macrostomum lignano TaxID=282301 RepID=A0A1I8FZC0_9PLAT
MHYNELQFSPLDSAGNAYSICLVEPDSAGSKPLGPNADRAVCLVAIAGGIVYAIRFADLDNRQRCTPLVVSRYILLDLKSNFHAKRKMFDEVVAFDVEICSIDSLQANGKTFVGLTFSKATRKPDSNEPITYGFALFELVRSSETKKMELVYLFKHKLAYMPSLLTHTKIYRLHESKLEDVFVCFCFEKSRHDMGCDCEHEKENLRQQYFPDIEHPLKNVFQAQFALANENKIRLSAWGTDTGSLRVCALDLLSLDLLATCSLEYDTSILNCRFLWPAHASSTVGASDRDYRDPQLGLLVSAITEPVVLFTGLFASSSSSNSSGNSSIPQRQVALPGTRDLDCPAFLCVLDVDEDGEDEIVVGSFCQRIQIYKRQSETGEYSLTFERLFNTPVQCVAHADVTGDGVRELLVLTVTGLHVLQRSRADIDTKLRDRLRQLGCLSSANEDAVRTAKSAS